MHAMHLPQCWLLSENYCSMRSYGEMSDYLRLGLPHHHQGQLPLLLVMYLYGLRLAPKEVLIGACTLDKETMMLTFHGGRNL